MKAQTPIPIASAHTPELIDRAIAERLEPGLAANRWRSDFAQFAEKRLWSEHHQKALLRKFEVALGVLRGRRILDLGCGRGGLTVALSRRGCRVVAMDLRRRNLETTILRGRRYALSPAAAAATGERLPFADRSFDLVICKDMLEHCSNPDLILAEIARVLAPGGVCFLTVINRFCFKDPHYHLWGVSFLPPAVAERYIAWRGRAKQSYRDCQKLGDMHYYRLPRFRQLAGAHGLSIRRDLHGLGRRSDPISLPVRLRRAAEDLAYGLGKRLSLGVACFELLLERNGTLERRSGNRSNGRFLLAATIVLATAFSATPAAAAATIQAFDLSDLRPGMRVEIKGELSGERFSASRATLKADDGHAIEVKAPIDPKPPPAADSLSFHLLGRPVVVLAGATVRGAASRADLAAAAKPGRWVKARCRDRGNLLLVESITLRSETAGSAEIEGPIDALKRRGNDRVLLEIGGFEVEVDDRAQLLIDPDERVPLLPRAVDDDDARPRSRHFLGGRASLGGQVRWDVNPESNLDLDRDLPGDRTDGIFTGQLEVAARFDPHWAGFVKGALTSTVGLNEPPGVNSDRARGQLHEMYLLWSSPLRWAALEVGRQDFDEPREWLYDENLDAVRIHLAPHRRAKIELALAGRLGVSGVDGERGYAIGYAQAALVRKSWAGAYAIGRNDPAGGDDARWLGLRAGGAPIRGLDPWLDLGILLGRTALRRHRGTAFDLGLTIQPLALSRTPSAFAARRPAVTIGLARGSGDADDTDDEDSTYRQTGFEDNTDTFAGVTSFKYYGELLDPELSNIRILTMGAGFRVGPSSSVDFVYHRYRQVVADNRLRSELQIQPLGDNPFLGSGTDLIFGMEEIQNLEIELDLAAFFPGRAFPDGSATATRASLQVKLNF